MNQFDAKQLNQVAYLILNGFDKSYRWYRRITGDAQYRFEQAQWHQAQSAVVERIKIYEQCLSDVVAEIYQHITPHNLDRSYWQNLKNRYVKLLDGHPQFELAETFYNSVIGRIYKHEIIDQGVMFILPSRCYLVGSAKTKVVNCFDTTGTVENMMKQIFETYTFNIEFENKLRDLEYLNLALRERLSKEQLASVSEVELLKPVFYRSKAAYIIGRICMPDTTMPFVIALMLNNERQLVVDTMLTDRKDLSVIFGFARSYFMADTHHPAEVTAFLQELLPNKKHFELYISLGLYKHGKTEFYRNFIEHLDHSSDKFEVAPGIRGLVMMVFHLPSYGVVFKIIKDEFAESKKITRDHVKDRYRLVKMSDRVGRMADTHEYANFRLPRERVSQALLDELLETCASSVQVTESEVTISHLYIERKMTPLNLYLQAEDDPEKVTNAINELGLCIKQIAQANIFPGDMLHKNFGITRHGRVIFYDYDEITLMHERTFRTLPKSDDPYAIDTLSVGPTDVFPEQFEHFIVGKRVLKEQLKALHPEIMQASYWQELQKQAQAEIKHFTPYSKEKRFRFKFAN